jgi:hypothetical protein
MSETSFETKTPAFRPTPSPSERKAAATTQAAREMTEAAREQRLVATAMLMVARFARDAEAGAQAAQKSPKNKGSRGCKC